MYTVMCAVVVSGSAACLLQRAILFPDPDPGKPLADSVRRELGLVQWQLNTDSGPVEAYFLPGYGVSADAPGPLVIFAHGNGGLIDDWVGHMAPYRQLGISVLLPEYRGYGRSAGRPSQEAIVRDYVQFYDRAVARSDVDPKRIAYHGRSLGGGVLCALGNERAPDVYVLESTFTSVRDIARRYFVPEFLILDPFDSLAVLRKFSGPVLVMHGRGDSVVPVGHGKRLAGAVSGSQLVLRDCGHNDCPRDSEYWRTIQLFLETSL